MIDRQVSRQGLRFQWQVFLLAVGFLTRLPMPPDPDFSDTKLDRTTVYFPFVGLIVGALVGAVSAVALWAFGNYPLAVLFGMAASLLITGAFHEDGLADSADGFGGGMQRDDVLRIMKDSRIGSYGAVALAAVLSLKAASLFALQDPVALAVALCWAHTISRAASCSLMLGLDYVRDEGKSKPLARQTGWGRWCLSLLPLLPLLCFSAKPALLFLVVSLVLFRLAYAAYLRRRIGGYTGDALGAAQQVSEVLVYLAFLV